jgi:hypothetical protein
MDLGERSSKTPLSVVYGRYRSPKHHWPFSKASDAEIFNSIIGASDTLAQLFPHRID